MSQKRIWKALPVILAVMGLFLVLGSVRTWAKADNVLTVSTEAELKNAVKKDGYNIVLQKDLTLQSRLDITGNSLVLSMNGHKLVNRKDDGSFMINIFGENIKIMDGTLEASLGDGFVICMQKDACDVWLEDMEIYGSFQCGLSIQQETGGTVYLNRVTIQQLPCNDDLYATIHVTGTARLVADTLHMVNGSYTSGMWDLEKPLIAGGEYARFELHNVQLQKRKAGKLLQVETDSMHAAVYTDFFHPGSQILLDGASVSTSSMLASSGEDIYQVRGTSLSVTISESQLQITNAELWVPEPSSGGEPGYWMDAEGQHVRTNMDSDSGYRNGIAWQGAKERRLSPDDTFVGGKYYVYLHLVPEPGWAFAENASIMVNDREAFFANYGDGYWTVRQEFQVPPVFTVVPEDQVAVRTDAQHKDPIPAYFKIDVDAEGAVYYQWQVSKDGGVTWTDCTDGKDGVSGSITRLLKVTGSDGNDGDRYQCVVTCGGIDYESPSAKLTVTSYPWISGGPDPVTATAGQTASFDVTVAGGDDNDFAVRWYCKAAGTSQWKAIAGKDTGNYQYQFKAETGQNGNQYRCEITRILDGKKITGCTTVSKAVKLTVKSSDLPFVDVKKSASYYDALVWAYGNGIVKGTDDTHFSPSKGTTRGEFCTMLWRLNGRPALTQEQKDANPFRDVTPGKGHGTAILWAYDRGIITGFVNDAGQRVFNPGGKITRTNMIVMMYKMAKHDYGADAVKVSYSGSPYKDIKATNKNLVVYQWAYVKKISRPSSGMFEPGASCLRWHLVFFLYRYNNVYHVK